MMSSNEQLVLRILVVICLLLVYLLFKSEFFYEALDNKQTGSDSGAAKYGLSNKNSVINTKEYIYNTRNVIDLQFRGQCLERIPSFQEAVVRQFKHVTGKNKKFTQGRHKIEDITGLANRTIFDIRPDYACVVDGVQFIHLCLHEREDGRASLGGSAFMVRSYSAYLVVCPVMDYFNGSYSIFCPVYDACANITVLLKHVAFSMFQGKTIVLEKMIWMRENVCVEETDRFTGMKYLTHKDIITDNKDIIQYSPQLPVPGPSLLATHGHWFHYKDSWKWITEKEHRVFPSQNNKTLCDCYRNFHKTFLIGASHLRFNRACLDLLCDLQSSLVRIRCCCALQMIKELYTVIEEINQDKNQSHRYAIILQLGAWDLDSYDLSDILNNRLPKLRDVIYKVHSSKSSDSTWLDRVRFMLMSTPSTPDVTKTGSRVLSRNNWMIAVFTHSLHQQFSDLANVLLLDEFSFTFPLYFYTAAWPQERDHHYALDRKTQCIGHVGKTWIQVMTEKLCPR